MRPAVAAKQLIMVLQAFIDESEGENGTFVLAGYVATAEAWAKFSRDWERMLPTQGTLREKENKYHFKMTEMAAIPERLKRVPGFLRVIEEHATCALSVRLNRHEVERATKRIGVSGAFPRGRIEWDYIKNPFTLSFKVLLDLFHHSKVKFGGVIPVDQPVDFIFDDRSEKRMIRKIWDEYLESRPADVRRLYGQEPRFLYDQQFLPLQAADFWAWWVREWDEAGVLVDRLQDRHTWPWPRGERDFPKYHIDITEDKLVWELKRMLREMIGNGPYICDVRYSRDERYINGE